MVIAIDAQKKEITMAVAARIRHFRQLNSLSQEAVALRANINPAYFGQIERGLKCPTIDTLYKITTALNVSLSEFLRLDSSIKDCISSEERIQSLLSQVPDSKREEVLKIFEEIVSLFT